MSTPTTQADARPRLDALFARCREQGRAALVGYLPAGFPTRQAALDGLRALVDGGVDAIEVGMPYSDPLMEGPVIQQAHQVALEGGTRLEHVLEAVRSTSADVPTLVMGYWNPVHRYGFDRWAATLREAGAVGAITPDLVPEEAVEWREAAVREGVDPVFLVAPSSTDERIRAVGQANRGFVYATAVMGVTGARAAVGSGAEQLVARVRAQTDLPVGVGLGVSNGDQAAEVGRFADAVIVGSALVSALRDGGPSAVRSLTAELAEGVRRSR